MRFRFALCVLPVFAFACATDTGVEPLVCCEEVDAVTVMGAPSPRPGLYAPNNSYRVAKGKYLVELLGCGSCHTDGALIGEPDMDKSLGGSHVGIAASNPLGDKYPGIVYPANITPDNETGIGLWSDQQIMTAIRAGIGRHGDRRISVMPWPGYAKLTDDDADAIMGYLRTIKPVTHRVPDEVAPGQPAKAPFVYFGVYQSRQ